MHNMSNIKYGMFACLIQEYGMLKVLHGYSMWNSDSKYGMFTEFYQYGMLNSNCKYGMFDTVLQYSMFSLNGMRNGSTWPCLRSNCVEGDGRAGPRVLARRVGWEPAH